MLQKLGKRLKDQKGLTLIELLAVIVILGIIAAIAIPSIGGIIQKTKEDAVKADAIQILNAAKLHISSTGIKDGETSKTLENDVLSKYLENVKFEGEYSVTVTAPTTDKPETEFKITGSGKAGKKFVNFNAATLKDINEDAGTVTVSDTGTSTD